MEQREREAIVTFQCYTDSGRKTQQVLKKKLRKKDDILKPLAIIYYIFLAVDDEQYLFSKIGENAKESRNKNINVTVLPNEQ